MGITVDESYDQLWKLWASLTQSKVLLATSAQLRSEKLLKHILGWRQYRRFYHDGYIDFTGDVERPNLRGRATYRLYRHDGNQWLGTWSHQTVSTRSGDRWHWTSYCALPFEERPRQLPAADVVAAIYLAIKADERKFRRQAGHCWEGNSEVGEDLANGYRSHIRDDIVGHSIPPLI